MNIRKKISLYDLNTRKHFLVDPHPRQQLMGNWWVYDPKQSKRQGITLYRCGGPIKGEAV